MVDRPKFDIRKVLVGRGGPTQEGWHKIYTLMRCAKAFQYSGPRGLRIPLAQTPGHFAVGLLLHAGRCRWFADGQLGDTKSAARVVDAMHAEAQKQKLPVGEKHMVNAQAIMSAYIEHWLLAPKPMPLAVEHKLGPVRLAAGHPMELTRTARLDDVSRYPEAGNALAIGECKSTSGDFRGVIQEYELHGQPMLQHALYRMSTRGQHKFGPVDGTVLDLIKKPETPKGKPKFSRVFVPVPEQALKWFIEDMGKWIAMAQKIDWDTPVLRNPGGCTFMAGRARIDCEFKDLCRFGKSQAYKYVFEDGSALRSWKPEPGKETPPWE